METHDASPDPHSSRRKGTIFLASGIVLLVLSGFMGISDNPPGILLMLAGLFTVALGAIYIISKSSHRTSGQQLLYWAPRALCLVFALFISLFALDVFDEGRSVLDTLLALLMHLIPTFLLLALLALSWRREWIAGILFPLLGIAYVIWSWNRPFGHWFTFLLMAGPLVLTGALFLLNWYYRKELR